MSKGLAKLLACVAAVAAVLGLAWMERGYILGAYNWSRYGAEVAVAQQCLRELTSESKPQIPIANEIALAQRRGYFEFTLKGVHVDSLQPVHVETHRSERGVVYVQLACPVEIFSSVTLGLVQKDRGFSLDTIAFSHAWIDALEASAAPCE